MESLVWFVILISLRKTTLVVTTTIIATISHCFRAPRITKHQRQNMSSNTRLLVAPSNVCRLQSLLAQNCHKLRRMCGSCVWHLSVYYLFLASRYLGRTWGGISFHGSYVTLQLFIVINGMKVKHKYSNIKRNYSGQIRRCLRPNNSQILAANKNSTIFASVFQR